MGTTSAASRDFLELLSGRRIGTISRRLSGDSASLVGKDLLVSAVNLQAIAASPEIEVHMPVTPDIVVAERARSRIAWRLLPFLFLLYVIAFLDRMNISAAALQMPGDLGFSDRVVGLGAGIFFLGYFLLGIPGALLAERWRDRKSTRLNSSHSQISYAVFCLKKKK